jgi:hypothetical protein
MLVHYSGDIVFTGAVFVIYCEWWRLTVAPPCCIRLLANCCFVLVFTLVASLISSPHLPPTHSRRRAPGQHDGGGRAISFGALPGAREDLHEYGLQPHQVRCA